MKTTKTHLIFLLALMIGLSPWAGADPASSGDGPCVGALSGSGPDPFAEFARIRAALSKNIVGQREFIERILIALLAQKGHILVEGAPGLAKTRALKVLAKITEGSFSRIQFRPDMSASDITTSYERGADGLMLERPGKIFHNFILADEINRGSGKSQAGLLEPMEEGQVTLLSGTHKLPRVFLVLATQNPLGDEGTNPLPLAQRDRFLMNVHVHYPEADEELAIMNLFNQEELGQLAEVNSEEFGAPVSLSTIEQAMRSRAQVLVSEPMKRLIVQIVRLSRPGHESIIGLNSGKILQGAGPRASIAFQVASQGRAWLNGRKSVAAEDIAAIAKDVLRHRIQLDRTAKASGINEDKVIELILRAAQEMVASEPSN